MREHDRPDERFFIVSRQAERIKSLYLGKNDEYTKHVDFYNSTLSEGFDILGLDKNRGQNNYR